MHYPRKDNNRGLERKRQDVSGARGEKDEVRTAAEKGGQTVSAANDAATILCSR